eukprot:2148628-Rhodomonas_salina.1
MLACLAGIAKVVVFGGDGGPCVLQKHTCSFVRGGADGCSGGAGGTSGRSRTTSFGGKGSRMLLLICHTRTRDEARC